MHVVVVESTAKARTIRDYLGAGYQVLATRGHVKDLPAKEGSVDTAQDFALVYTIMPGAGPTLGAIATALRDADTLVLATDPDREGEAIAWQVLTWLQDRDVLKDRTVQRVVFHEVTPEAVHEAMARPREIDMDLVRAQQTRRALDYLVGFHLSALLWRKVRGVRSAGRVQSVSLRLICARESEIEEFEPKEYWRVDAIVSTGVGGAFRARLSRLDGELVDRTAIGSAARAGQAVRRIREGDFRVAAVERDRLRRNPVPPFTTSTLQQEASRQLGFGVRKTMHLAQTLYEGVELDGETSGLLTYVRTDSVTMSKAAIAAVRRLIQANFSSEYLPRNPRRFRTRTRNTQEAHEAIRPTDLARTPDQVEGRLGEDEAKLYALVWKRAVASQMAAARLDRTRVELVSESGDIVLTATGSQTLFDGFLRLYREGRDEDGGDDERDRALPAMVTDERAFVVEARSERRFTLPPPRYTEASLVRRLEELGIGRPSTYAAIVDVLRARGYAVLYRRHFVPTERGRIVTAFLEEYFEPWIAYRFTTELEADLDRVAEGAMAYRGVLGSFWGTFEQALGNAAGLGRDEIRATVESALERFIFAASPGRPVERTCPSCSDGWLGLKFGRYGAFIGCLNYPECRYTRPLGTDPADHQRKLEPVPLGTDPDTGLLLTLRHGHFGHYVQLGDNDADGRAPRGTVPTGMKPDEITPEVARALLAMPRTIGVHPDTGKTILAGIGLYGSWLKHGAIYVSLPDDEDVLTIGLNRAVALVDTR